MGSFLSCLTRQVRGRQLAKTPNRWHSLLGKVHPRQSMRRGLYPKSWESAEDTLREWDRHCHREIVQALPAHHLLHNRTSPLQLICPSMSKIGWTTFTSSNITCSTTSRSWWKSCARWIPTSTSCQLTALNCWFLRRLSETKKTRLRTTILLI